jgi:hypothetical protein
LRIDRDPGHANCNQRGAAEQLRAKPSVVTLKVVVYWLPHLVVN